MPLHLLGKKSWNVYNPANVARVKADEEAAAAREAAADQRMQELDAERRAAILRGRTPPPLPVEDDAAEDGRCKRERDGGHDWKRRKLRGEDDTDMDIRLAASMSKSRDRDSDGEDAKVLKLRRAGNDAPLTDHAGHIDLFPVDMKESLKREKNAEAEKEKRKREQAFEDQYTMRFSNAAGREGLGQPWYTAQRTAAPATESGTPALEYPGFENKDVWGNEDSRRKEREQARMSSNDPFAFMQKAQTQLKKSKEDKKKWADERKRELKELRQAQDVEERMRKDHARSSHRHESRRSDREPSHKHSNRKHRSRSRSRERDRGDREHSRRHSSSRQERRDRPSSPRRRRSRSPSRRRRREQDKTAHTP